jgi:hypothetical protein
MLGRNGEICEAESRVVTEEPIVKTVPTQNDLATTHVEIRDKKTAATVPHKRCPSKDCLAFEMFPEEGDAFLMDFL